MDKTESAGAGTSLFGSSPNGSVSVGMLFWLRNMPTRLPQLFTCCGASESTAPKTFELRSALEKSPVDTDTTGTAIIHTTTIAVKTCTTAPTAASALYTARVRIMLRRAMPMEDPMAYPMMTARTAMPRAKRNRVLLSSVWAIAYGAAHMPTMPPMRTPMTAAIEDTPPCLHPECIADSAMSTMTMSTMVDPLIQCLSVLVVGGCRR